MNSDEKRLLRQFENYDHYQSYYSQDRVWDRITQPGFFLPLVLLAVVVYCHLIPEQPRVEHISEVLWNGLVKAIPGRLLTTVDGWLNPPLFPLPMLQPAPPLTLAAKSDVLKRVLGMEKATSIMASVSQAGRRSLTHLSSFQSDPDKPAGLGNISNSCYQNSILQGLASLRPLRAYLTNLNTSTTPRQIKTGTVDTLRDLVADLNSPKNNGKTLWTPSILKNMSTWQQQDAQEYFSRLLDEIDREVARLALVTASKQAGLEVVPPSPEAARDDTATASQHSDDSGYQSLSTHSKSGSTDARRPLRNPLEGLQAQRVACTACGHSDGLSMIPFNCLTLNLGTTGAEHDLYERLDSYTRVESIPGVECAKCTLLKYQRLIGRLVETAETQGRTETDLPEPYRRLRAIGEALENDDFDDETLGRCKIAPQHKVGVTKTKQAVVARPPQSLVVHVNRSVFDEVTGRMWKNGAPLRFPSVLDLGPWCLGSADVKGDDEERWGLDPDMSMVAGEEGRSQIAGPVYELRAVITHYGRHENGHYVCYRRHAKARRREGEGGDGKMEEEEEKEEELEMERPAQLAGENEGVEYVDGVANLEGQQDTVEQAQDISEDQEEESQWWRLSDQDVTKVDEEVVMAQTNVFMLFYDRVDPNSTLTTEKDEFVDTVSEQKPGEDGATSKPGEGDSTEDLEKAKATPLPEEDDELL